MHAFETLIFFPWKRDNCIMRISDNSPKPYSSAVRDSFYFHAKMAVLIISRKADRFVSVGLPLIRVK